MPSRPVADDITSPSQGRTPLPVVTGKNLRLRPVIQSDAEFIFALRQDASVNQYLSPVSGTAEDQRAWIERYEIKAANGEEAYFIIERADGAPCGTVRLYDMNDRSFTWGSFVLLGNKPRKAALEAALLSFEIGFDVLNKTDARIDVLRDNHRAIAFYRRFGMTETGADEESLYFKYSKADFEMAKPTLSATIATE